MPKIKRDLSIFDGKMTWKERLPVIESQFPHMESLNWGLTFEQDPTILGNIINDIIKVSVSEKGRPGKRSSVSHKRTADDFKFLQNDDYSHDDFITTFKALTNGMTFRQIAEVTSLDKMLIHRMMKGTKEPSVEQLEQIARAFHKHPSYFTEWRVGFVTAALANQLTQNPEKCIIAYNKVKRL